MLLDAEFVAAVQIIVYAGAIMVLFIFVIMLLNAGDEERTNVSRMARYVGVPLARCLAGRSGLSDRRAPLRRMAAQPAAEARSTRDLSMLLFRDYVFPFELTSILILIALLGALVLAQPRRVGVLARLQMRQKSAECADRFGMESGGKLWFRFPTIWC